MHRGSWVAVGGAVVCLASACAGASAKKVEVGTVVASAASRSQSENTYHFTGVGAGDFGSSSISGEVDVRARSFEMTTTVTPSAGIGGSVSGSPGGTLALPQMPAKETTIVIGSRVWTSNPLLGTVSRPWLLMSGLGRTGAHTFAETVPFDPSEILAEMKAHMSNVRVVGTATVGGVATTEYQGSGLPWPSPSSGPGPAGQEGAEVWVDQQGLVRQVRLSFNEPGLPGLSSTLSGTMTVDFSDYGQPVDVQAPPANEVEQLPVGIVSSVPTSIAIQGAP